MWRCRVVFEVFNGAVGLPWGAHEVEATLFTVAGPLSEVALHLVSEEEGDRAALRGAHAPGIIFVESGIAQGWVIEQGARVGVVVVIVAAELDPQQLRLALFEVVKEDFAFVRVFWVRAQSLILSPQRRLIWVSRCPVWARA